MDTTTRSLIEQAPLAIIDFDGTLVHLATDWTGVKIRVEERALEEGWNWNRNAGIDANLRRIRSQFGERAFTALCGLVALGETVGFRPNAVATDLVEVLSQRHPAPVAIVSNNSRRSISLIMKRPELSGVKALIVGKEDVAVSKPSPDGVLQACALTGVAPHEAIFLGDSELDKQAARRAGVGTFLWAKPPIPTTRRLAA